jgi:hypothetical protein
LIRHEASLLRAGVAAAVVCASITAHADPPATPPIHWVDDYAVRYDALFRLVALRTIAITGHVDETRPADVAPHFGNTLRYELDRVFRMTFGSFLFGGGVVLLAPTRSMQLKLNPRAFLRPGVPLEGGEVVLSGSFQGGALW